MLLGERLRSLIDIFPTPSDISANAEKIVLLLINCILGKFFSVVKKVVEAYSPTSGQVVTPQILFDFATIGLSPIEKKLFLLLKLGQQIK